MLEKHTTWRPKNLFHSLPMHVTTIAAIDYCFNICTWNTLQTFRRRLFLHIAWRVFCTKETQRAFGREDGGGTFQNCRTWSRGAKGGWIHEKTQQADDSRSTICNQLLWEKKRFGEMCLFYYCQIVIVNDCFEREKKSRKVMANKNRIIISYLLQGGT